MFVFLNFLIDNVLIVDSKGKAEKT